MSKINVTRSSMPEFSEYCEEIKSIWDSRWLTNMGPIHNRFKEQIKNNTIHILKDCYYGKTYRNF